MLSVAWSWAVPVLAAAGVFAFVLATTPPGFASVQYVLIGGARGATADAAAYALGAAASLALLVLVALAAILGAMDRLLRRRSS